MWKRNLLFVGLILVGLGSLGANLFPPAAPPRVPDFDADALRDPSFRAVVEDVNRAFREHWSAAGVEPAPRADDLTLARRLSLGLTGTVPSLQEVRQLEQYSGEERVQWWLEGLLRDRRHADYFAERFSRAFVGTEDGPFVFYRRRRFVHWLSDQVASNRPYDAVVRDLVATDGLWTDRPATNFITVTLHESSKGRPDPVRLAGRVSRAFLGVRIDCAQCHNHPFAKWTQRDFQGLSAFFGQTVTGLTGIHEDGAEYQLENRKTGVLETIAASVPFLPELLPDEGTRRQRLAAWVTDRRNPYFSRAAVNRVWALLFGRPLADPVDDLPTDSPPHPALRRLADDFADHGFDVRRLLRVLAATDVFRLDSASQAGVTAAQEREWAAFPVTRLRPEQVVGAVIQAASLETIDAESHIFVKLARWFGERDFVERYGDTGEDEFDGRGGTIPQRLLLMNGDLVYERTKQNLFNAATRIANLAPDDRKAVEAAYLAALTRRPTPAEAAHFEARLGGARGDERIRRAEDLFWALINSTEFSWNH